MPVDPSELEFVLVDRTNGVIVLTLNRPESANAFSVSMTTELRRVVEIVEEWPERSLVITGAGDKAFSAGADLREMLEMTEVDAERSLSSGIALTRMLEQSSKVTIAAINGLALGGGTEIALACDIRIASPSARLGLPEVTVGIFPGWGGTVRLPRLIPRGLAIELLLTGKWIDATEAKAIGLVNQVADDPLGTAIDLSYRLAKGAPLAQAQIKRVVRSTEAMEVDRALDYESEAWMAIFDAADRREGHHAFIEKRQAAWTGR